MSVGNPLQQAFASQPDTFSAAVPMRATPYAIGERGPNSRIRTIPLFSGEDAFQSLSGYYPTRLQDSRLGVKSAMTLRHKIAAGGAKSIAKTIQQIAGHGNKVPYKGRSFARPASPVKAPVPQKTPVLKKPQGWQPTWGTSRPPLSSRTSEYQDLVEAMRSAGRATAPRGAPAAAPAATAAAKSVAPVAAKPGFSQRVREQARHGAQAVTGAGKQLGEASKKIPYKGRLAAGAGGAAGGLTAANYLRGSGDPTAGAVTGAEAGGLADPNAASRPEAGPVATAVVNGGGAAFDWLKQNWKGVAAAGGASLVALLAYHLWRKNQQSSEEEEGLPVKYAGVDLARAVANQFVLGFLVKCAVDRCDEYDVHHRIKVACSRNTYILAEFEKCAYGSSGTAGPSASPSPPAKLSPTPRPTPKPGAVARAGDAMLNNAGRAAVAPFATLAGGLGTAASGAALAAQHGWNATAGRLGAPKADTQVPQAAFDHSQQMVYSGLNDFGRSVGLQGLDATAAPDRQVREQLDAARELPGVTPGVKQVSQLAQGAGELAANSIAPTRLMRAGPALVQGGKSLAQGGKSLMQGAPTMANTVAQGVMNTGRSLAQGAPGMANTVAQGAMNTGQGLAQVGGAVARNTWKPVAALAGGAGLLEMGQVAADGGTGTEQGHPDRPVTSASGYYDWKVRQPRQRAQIEEILAKGLQTNDPQLKSEMEAAFASRVGEAEQELTRKYPGDPNGYEAALQARKADIISDLNRESAEVLQERQQLGDHQSQLLEGWDASTLPPDAQEAYNYEWAHRNAALAASTTSPHELEAEQRALKAELASKYRSLYPQQDSAGPAQQQDPAAATQPDPAAAAGQQPSQPGQQPTQEPNQQAGLGTIDKLTGGMISKLKQIPEQMEAAGEQVKQFIASDDKLGQIAGMLGKGEAPADPGEIEAAAHAKVMQEAGVDEQTAWDAIGNMDFTQKALLFGGLGLGAVGLISALTAEDGGILPWLLAAVGLGGAAFGAGSAGLLGQGAKDLTGGITDAVSGNNSFQPNQWEQMAMPGLASAGMLDNVIVSRAKADPALAQQLDRAIGHGSWGNSALSIMGDLTGTIQRTMQDAGIPKESIPEILEAWKQHRQAAVGG